MDNNDKKRFTILMMGLAEDCSATITNAGLRIKFEAMKNYTIDQIEDAVVKVVKENVFTKMPTTGTIIKAIEGTKDDKADYQYNLVLRAIRELGSYTHPKFKDPITQSLINNRFGWGKVCNTNPKDMEFFAREFKAAYQAASNGSGKTMIGHKQFQNVDFKLQSNLISKTQDGETHTQVFEIQR